MNILGLVGSPRKQGNTDILVDQVLKGGASRGYAGEKVYLYDCQMSGCIDCRSCKTGDLVCAVKDGMQALYPKIDAADVVVFGTPVYFYGPTGKMKLLIDRLRPYTGSKKLKGKRAIIVAPSGVGARAADALVMMCAKSLEYLGMQVVDKLLPAASGKGDIQQKPDELKRAYDLGAGL